MNSVSLDTTSSWVMLTKIQDQGLGQPAADDIFGLCEDFLVLHEEFSTIPEHLLLRLYQYHDSYSAGATRITTSFQGL